MKSKYNKRKEIGNKIILLCQQILRLDKNYKDISIFATRKNNHITGTRITKRTKLE